MNLQNRKNKKKKIAHIHSGNYHYCIQIYICVCVYIHTHTYTQKGWTVNNLPHPINPAAKDMTRARIPVITWPAVETTTG